MGGHGIRARRGDAGVIRRLVDERPAGLSSSDALGNSRLSAVLTLRRRPYAPVDYVPDPHAPPVWVPVKLPMHIEPA